VRPKKTISRMLTDAIIRVVSERGCIRRRQAAVSR
jgi:hypothetical protein